MTARSYHAKEYYLFEKNAQLNFMHIDVAHLTYSKDFSR